jgi:hypothetical protein
VLSSPAAKMFAGGVDMAQLELMNDFLSTCRRIAGY